MNAKDVPQEEFREMLIALRDFIEERGFRTTAGKVIDAKDICDAVERDQDLNYWFSGLFAPFFPAIDIEGGDFPNSRQLGQFLGSIAGNIDTESGLRVARAGDGWRVEKVTDEQLQEERRIAAQNPPPKPRRPRRLSLDFFLALNECVRQFGTRFSNGKRLRTMELARAIAQGKPAAAKLWKHLAEVTGYEPGKRPPNTRVLGHLLSRTRNMYADGWCVCTSPGFWWVEEGAGRGDPAVEKVAKHTKVAQNCSKDEKAHFNVAVQH